jgi:hypothetical protein
MPTFFQRRYSRGVDRIGRTEKVLGALFLLLTAGLVVVFITQVVSDEDYLFETTEAAEAQSPFPAPALENWRAPAQVSPFTPETLYVKINGRAEVYLRLNVEGLAFGTYCHEADRDRTIDVYWYDMGEPANALGIFQVEAAPEADPVSVGREGYQIGGAVFFHTAGSYVQVMPSDAGDGDAALTIARLIAERIERER